MPEIHLTHQREHAVDSTSDHTVAGLAGVLKIGTGKIVGGAAHADLGGVGANDHHNQQHVLTGGDHTASGLTTGHVLTASGATTFGWSALPAFVAPGRTISTTAPLAGGGDLSANRTLSLGYTANLKVTGGNLDTVQDLQTGSTPRFAGLVCPVIKPAADSTTALKLANAAGTALLTVDTTNNAIGLRTTPGGLTQYGVRYPTLHLDCTANIGYGLFLERKDCNATNSPGVGGLAQRTGSAALQSGDYMMSVFAWGWDGASYAPSAGFQMFCDGAVATNSVPGRLSISTKAVGSTTMIERMIVNNAGNLLLGTTTDGLTASGSLAIAKDLAHRGTLLGFYNTAPAAKPTVTGSRGGNAALASLLTALAGLGLLTNSTSA